MNNTFLTPEVVAKEALMVLTGNLVMADLVHRDYSDELVSVGDTVSIRKPAKCVAKNFLGNTEAQDITGGQKLIQLSYSGRMLVLFLLLFLCAKSGRFHVLALAIPLVFTRPILTVSELFKKKGGNAA